MVTLKEDATESCVFAFLIDIATMLHENASLESLSIRKSGSRIKAEEYIALVTALQHNTTSKTLSLVRNERLLLTDDERKQSASLPRKTCIGKSSRYLPDE
jgi:hypothetical protein